MNVGRKLIFTGLVQGVLLIALELGLRLHYPALPSIAGLVGSRFAMAPGFGRRSTEGCDERFSAEPQKIGDHLLVLGDSVAAGFRVHPSAAFPALVSNKLGMQLELYAREGQDLCLEIEGFRRRMGKAPWPRAVLWEVLEDDLVSYMVYSLGGRLSVVPESETDPTIRWWISSSYLLNLGWFEYKSRYGVATSRMVDPMRIQSLMVLLATIQKNVEGRGVPVIPVLVEPVGMEGCPEDAPTQSPCNWMRIDGENLYRIFKKAGFEMLDLRGIWKGESLAIPEEAGAKPPIAVAIHPNAEGHQRLADRMIPELQRRLTDSGASRLPGADNPLSPP